MRIRVPNNAEPVSQADFICVGEALLCRKKKFKHVLHAIEYFRNHKKFEAVKRLSDTLEKIPGTGWLRPETWIKVVEKLIKE